MRTRAAASSSSSGIVVVGADLSLTGTALVAVRGAGADYPSGCGPEVIAARRMPTRDVRGLTRLNEIDEWVHRFFDDLAFREMSTLAVVFEGPGFASKVAHALGQVHGVIKLSLWRRRLTLADVPPSTLKKFVTGHGNSDKNVVMKRVFTRWGFDSDDDNECDAFGAAMVGLCHFGGGNQTQQKTLAGKVVLHEGRGASSGAATTTHRAQGGPVAGRHRRRRVS